jgi:ferric-dicitrate binding protein FerR (iron transport regulator)
MRNVPVDRYFSWLEGVVQFEDEALGNAARVIERQYGLAIRITDSALARRRFTGSIRGASLHADLRGLALLLDARYERQGNQVILGP